MSLSYCEEGDNIPDAVQCAGHIDSLLDILGQQGTPARPFCVATRCGAVQCGILTPPVRWLTLGDNKQWVPPASWQRIGGSDPERSLYM